MGVVFVFLYAFDLVLVVVDNHTRHSAGGALVFVHLAALLAVGGVFYLFYFAA